MIRTKVLVGIARSVSLILSVLVYSTTFGGSVYAADTGGYPWHDANVVNSSTYDWGYTVCRPEMQSAQVCNTHNSYRNGQKYHISDPWRYDVRNCTSFAAWKMADKFKTPIVNWGDAKNWDNAARRAGYKVSNLAQKNSIAVWERGYYGHVAIVTEVNPDGSVNVEQYNRAGKGEYSRESRVRADHYIHVAPETPSEPIVVVEPPKIQEILSLSALVSNSNLPQTKIAEAVPVQSDPTLKVPNPTESAEAKTEQPVQNQANQKAKDHEGTSYFVGSHPQKHHVKAYAIKHKATKSGKVEVQTHDMHHEHSKWDDGVVTPEVLPTTASISYNLADYNADGTLDLFTVAYSQTASGKVEVSVLDGLSNYANYLGKWTTVIEAHAKDDVWYSVADHNGDGNLDIYEIWQNNTKSEHVEVRIIDGANKYSSLLNEFMLAEKQHSNLDAYYMLGDNNSDGKTDLFQILHNNTESNKLEVKIFDGYDDYRDLIGKWVSDQDSYSGVGPVLN